jgi:hypothetical protein
MVLAVAALLTLGVIVFTLRVRQKDIPEPELPSPTDHLEERKARIYENLRDLQFEYRLGKLSDEDYQRTKLDLQQELARVLAEIEGILKKAPPPVAPKKPSSEPAPPATANACPHCGARFAQALKFCGECGQPMSGGAA